MEPRGEGPGLEDIRRFQRRTTGLQFIFNCNFLANRKIHRLSGQAQAGSTIFFLRCRRSDTVVLLPRVYK